jgi:hypothetical protein
MGQIPLSERSIEPSRESLVPVKSQTESNIQNLAYPLSEIVSKIQASAYAEGFSPPLFTVVSGYRSIAEQVYLYEQGLKKYGPELVRKYVAKPGNSAHHTGFAVDINLGYPTNSENIEAIRATRAYKFMQKEAAKYGLWELPSEPWHWELDKEARDAYLASKAIVETPRTRPVAPTLPKQPSVEESSDVAILSGNEDTVKVSSKMSLRDKKILVGAFVVSTGALLIAAYTINRRYSGV